MIDSLMLTVYSINNNYVNKTFTLFTPYPNNLLKIFCNGTYLPSRPKLKFGSERRSVLSEFNSRL